jgi:hypothetical protein
MLWFVRAFVCQLTMGLCGSREYTLVCCDWEAPQRWPGAALQLAQTLLCDPAVLAVHYCPTACTVVGRGDCDASWVWATVSHVLGVPVTSHAARVTQSGLQSGMAARAHECWRGAVARLAQQHCPPSVLDTAGQVAALAAAGIHMEDVPYWERWGVTLKRATDAPVSVTYMHITRDTDPAVFTSQ